MAFVRPIGVSLSLSLSVIRERMGATQKRDPKSVRSTNRGLSVSISLGNPGAHGCHTEARPQIVNEDAFYGQRRVRLPHRQGRMNAINTTDVVSQQAALPSQSTEKKNAGNVLHFRTDQKDHDLDHLQIRNVTI